MGLNKYMPYEREYYTYILANNHGMLYVGVTGDIFTRVQQHKKGEGGAYTSKYKCHRLVYYEAYRYVYDAIGREKQIKTWCRKKKEALIHTINPNWRDLSMEFGLSG